MHAETWPTPEETMHRPGTSFPLEVTPRIPPELARLEELANNLWFSWHRATRELFTRLDPQVWNAVGHSPKALLKAVDQRRLLEAAADSVFLHDLDRTLATYDASRFTGYTGPSKRWRTS